MRENLPIPSLLKCRRIKMKESIDERCWAFMKQLRTHHKGKKILDINPYAEVYPVRENVYAILNESLDGAGDVWMYLIVGEEKAMLIDTGFGVGDLKGLCNLLSGGKELIVANTPALEEALAKREGVARLNVANSNDGDLSNTTRLERVAQRVEDSNSIVREDAIGVRHETCAVPKLYVGHITNAVCTRHRLGGCHTKEHDNDSNNS